MNINTVVTYTGNGSRTDFPVPFDYLSKKFVKVFIDSKEVTGGRYEDYSSAYYFRSKTEIRFRTPPKVGAEVTIRRFTSVTDRVVSFKDASVLRADDLDLSLLQTFHIAEEGRDAYHDSLTLDTSLNWNARGKRVVNLGNPVNTQDAVPYGFYKADAEGARVSAQKAEASATAAKGSEAIAVEKAELAKTSADASRVSEQAAQVANAAAALHEAHAKTHAQTAEAAATRALTSAGEAETSAERARGVVTTVEAFASDARAAANEAGASVGTVVAAATKAEGFAEEAKLSATKSATAVSKAELEASNSSNSASSAREAADKAVESKTLAETAATNATTVVENIGAAEARVEKFVKAADDAAMDSWEYANNARGHSMMAQEHARKAFDEAERAKGYAGQAAQGQVQADWNEVNTEAKGFIKNKPNLDKYALASALDAKEDKAKLKALAYKDKVEYPDVNGLGTLAAYDYVEEDLLNPTLLGRIQDAEGNAQEALFSGFKDVRFEAPNKNLVFQTGAGTTKSVHLPFDNDPPLSPEDYNNIGDIPECVKDASYANNTLTLTKVNNKTIKLPIAGGSKAEVTIDFYKKTYKNNGAEFWITFWKFSDGTIIVIGSCSKLPEGYQGSTHVLYNFPVPLISENDVFAIGGTWNPDSGVFTPTSGKYGTLYGVNKSYLFFSANSSTPSSFYLAGYWKY